MGYYDVDAYYVILRTKTLYLRASTGAGDLCLREHAGAGMYLTN